MTTYQTTIPTPDDFQDFLGALLSWATNAKLSPGGDEIVLEFQADDEWGLHEQVVGVRDEISSNLGLYVEIPRPTKVESPDAPVAAREVYGFQITLDVQANEEAGVDMVKDWDWDYVLETGFVGIENVTVVSVTR